MQLKILNKSIDFFAWMVLLFTFSPILSLQETAAPSIIYVMAIALPTLIKDYGRRFVTPFNLGYLMAIMFVIVGLFSCIFNGYFSKAILKVFIFALFYIKVTRIRFKSQDIVGMTKLYVLMACCLAVLVLLSFVFGYPHQDSEVYMSRYSIGITGLYKNPNYIASFISVAYFVILYILMYRKNSLRSIIAYFSISLLFLVSFFLSGTRASLLTSISTTVILLLTYTFKSKNKLASFIIVVCIVFIVIRSLDSLSLMLEMFLGNRTLGTDEGRTSSWIYALRSFKTSPILGFGLKGWEIVSQGTSYMIFLHNIFIEMLLDYGLCGFTAFLVMLFYGIRNIKKQDRLFVLLLLFVTIFPMLFQNGLTEVNLWRSLILNRIAIDYSRHSQKGITYIITQNNIYA